MNVLFRNQPQEAEQPKKKRKAGGKPFAKGGDPRINKLGRPKLGVTLAAKYRDALAEAENEVKNGAGYSKLDAMIDILMAKALEGDFDAIRYLNERAYGKVPDRLELLPNGDEEADMYDYARLTTDETQCLLFLLEKAAGEEPKALSEFVGTEQRQFRFVLAREYMPALADIVEGTVKE